MALLDDTKKKVLDAQEKLIEAETGLKILEMMEEATPEQVAQFKASKEKLEKLAAAVDKLRLG